MSNKDIDDLIREIGPYDAIELIWGNDIVIEYIYKLKGKILGSITNEQIEKIMGQNDILLQNNH